MITPVWWNWIWNDEGGQESGFRENQNGNEFCSGIADMEQQTWTRGRIGGRTKWKDFWECITVLYLVMIVVM
jgi:hypothetical protein